jgi:hypothetical protein
VFDGDDAIGDCARLEHPRQGFLQILLATIVRSLNPWHFDSRFPAANCVFELDNKLSGERNSLACTVVSPLPESALVDIKCSTILLVICNVIHIIYDYYYYDII